VIAAGFGLHDFIGRHGIERRVHTAGESKSFLDPFRPEKPEDVARLHSLLGPIHETFKAHVRSRRGSRLSAAADLFTGEVWVGEEAVRVGLADGIAHLVPRLKALYGDKVRLIPYGQKKTLFQRIGGQFAGAVGDEIAERALWSRYGV